MVERSEIGEHADRDLAVLVQWERLDQRDRPLRGTAIFHFGNHRWRPREPPAERDVNRLRGSGHEDET